MTASAAAAAAPISDIESYDRISYDHIKLWPCMTDSSSACSSSSPAADVPETSAYIYVSMLIDLKSDLDLKIDNEAVVCSHYHNKPEMHPMSCWKVRP